MKFINKSEKTFMILFIIFLYICFGVITFVMSEPDSISSFISNYRNYYEFYLLLGPSFIASIFFYSYKDTQNLLLIIIKLLISIVLDISLCLALKAITINKSVIILICAIIIFIPVSLILSYLIDKLIDSRNKAYLFLCKNKYFFTITSFFIIKFLFEFDGKINEWAAVWHVMNYTDDGIGSRMLIGSILSLLNHGYVSTTLINIALISTLFSIIIIIAYLINKIINNAAPNKKLGLIFISLIYVFTPGSPRYLWDTENFGRLDTYLILLVLIQVILFRTIKNTYLKYFVLIIFSVICNATYQAYLFLFFPAICTLIICEIFITNHNTLKIQVINIVGTILTLLATAASFIFFQFFTSFNYDNVDDMVSALQSRTNMTVERSALWCEAFSNVKVSWLKFQAPMIVPGNGSYLRERGLIILLLLLPVLVLILSAWKSATLHFHENNIKAHSHHFYLSPYFWINICNLAIIPQFILTMDWGRWFGAFFSIQILEILYLCFIGDSGMNMFIEKLSIFVSRHKFLCFTILIYLLCLSPFKAGYQSSDAIKILRNIVKILGGYMDPI